MNLIDMSEVSVVSSDDKSEHRVHRDDVAILVASFDGYKDLWEPFFGCFFKYWPDCPYPVFLGSNAVTYHHKQIDSILVGSDQGYTSNLIAMLEQLDYPWIILWVDDAFLSRPVDTARLKQLIANAKAEQAASLKLIASKSTRSVANPSSTGIGEIPRGTPYRVSISLSLWQKRSLLDCLIPGLSAWQIELNGTFKALQTSNKYFGVANVHREPVLDFVHGVIKGKWTPEAVEFLNNEGFARHLGTRERLSWTSQVYIWLRNFVPDFVVNWWHQRQLQGKSTGVA